MLTLTFIRNHREKLFSLGFFLGSQFLFSGSAFSIETYPIKPITFVVSSSPGGGTDGMARLIAESMSQDLRQPIIVENIPGAGGAIAAKIVAKSKPDGYKVLFTTGGFVIAPLVLPNSGYDPVKQFFGVRQIATVPLIVVVKRASIFNSLSDLIAFARKDDSITYASFGIGTPSHIAGEAIKQYSGIELTHIPYAGSSKALPDIQSGRVTFGILDASFAAPMIQQGVLKGLAITGQQRLNLLPDVPTLKEVGIPFELVGWYGVFVPAETGSEVIVKLRDAFDRSIAKSSVKQRILSSGLGYVDDSMSPIQWNKKYLEDMQQWDELIKKLNILKE